MSWPLLLGLVALGASALMAPVVIAIARRFGVVDEPVGGRKVHKRTTPLLGGLGLFVVIAALVGVVLWRSDLLTAGEVTAAHYIGILLALLVLMIGGAIDDARDLSPKWQILFPVLASLIAIAGGVGIEKMTNPFGGYLYLETTSATLLSWPGWELIVSWPGDLFVFVWLVGMMYTFKLLDGLDGLATSIGSVGTLMVLLLAASVAYFQPDVVVLASIILGALLGFLFWNIHPAKLFLGEGGALLVGFLLGVLAVISGGKIATLLLVVGVPVLDVVWVIWRRLRSKKQLSKGDRYHLHHRLFDLGWSHSQVVLLYTVIALTFGVLTLVLSSFAKLLALIILGLGMLVGVYALLVIERKRT